MRVLPIAIAALYLGAAPAQAQPADPERPAIVAQVDRFFGAMAKQDVQALRAMMYPDGVMTISRIAPDGTVRHIRQPFSAWIEGIAEQPGLDERMWDPQVMRRGPMAVVWAPYEIRLDGKTLHCGIDVFDLVKVDGAWKIASLMFTAEPGACPELKAGGD